MINDKVKSICRYLKRAKYGYCKPELFINLTYSCPLRCKYCYVNYNKDNDFDLENLCYLFEEGILKTSYIKLITFFGGEPLLKIDLIESLMEKYYERLCKNGIHIAVITSLSINAEKHIEMIKKYPLYETVISFDNFSEERIYANQKPFKILEHIDLNELQKYNRNICFHCVLDSEKSLDDLLLLQEIFERYGIIYSWCWNKTPTKVFNFKEKYKQVIKNILNSEYKPLQFTRELSAYFNRDSLGCGIGSEMFLSSNGDISPCSISHHNNEFLLMKEGVIQEEATENIQNIEENNFNNDSCRDCGLKGFCNGGCLFERKKNRGSYDSVNPILCEIMKQLEEVYDELFSDVNSEDKKKLVSLMFDNYMGNIDYCYNTRINIDMYDYFNLGEK